MTQSNVLAVKEALVRSVSENLGDGMAEYVKHSMETDPDSPFSTMLMDALTARGALSVGDVAMAREIVQRYRSMAEASGYVLMFDAMMEAIGLGPLALADTDDAD